MRALELPTGDYAIFGSGPLAAHGLIHKVNDIDLVARGAAWEMAQRLAPVERAPKGDEVVRLAGGAIEIFRGWLHLDIDVVIDRTQMIAGLPFAQLEDVLCYKRLLNRPKDRGHIRLIEAYLRNR